MIFLHSLQMLWETHGNGLHLGIDHGWGRLAMIAIMGMMVQDAFAAGL